MGNHPVKKVDAQSAGKDAGDGHHKTPFPTVVQRGQDQAYNCRCQHDTGRKGQDDVAEFMGKILKSKAQQGAEHRRTAYAQSCQ